VEQKLKERLIGTAVITALAAIFLPMLIDEDDQRWVKQQTALDVPPLPEKFKTKPKILTEAGVDERRLFPTTEKSATVNPESTSSDIASDGKSGTGTVLKAVPVIKKPVLKAPLIKDKPPGMEQQLKSLLPATKRHAGQGQITSRQPDAVEKSSVIRQKKTQRPEKSVAKAKPAIQIPGKQQTRQSIPATVSKVAQNKPMHAEKKVDKTLNSDLTGLWIVQAGVFKGKSNAEALRKKLSDNGFAAYLETVNTELGELIRVRVGRVPEESAARQMVSTLNKRFGLKSITFPETKWNSKRAGH